MMRKNGQASSTYSDREYKARKENHNFWKAFGKSWTRIEQEYDCGYEDLMSYMDYVGEMNI